MTSSNKPVEKFTVGSVTASVFRNEGKDGAVFYKTSIENRYRQGEDFKTTAGYSQHQLVNLAKAALLAHSAIVKLTRSEEAAEEPAADADAA